ncbi:PEP-CTERM sorting domain-containing protein [Candidatus Accumulibacter phosphatis]|uniref:Ice-binding protein C-terminal domain-containing protein n=1 Tax=Candidatus Accumulibacter phosphatis TaxID=327160 RepID=A0A5S4EI45_9PROT|nr:PEP-CTERM sorting domain-containing protein [Candidatus Accumulibacter phosphatis]TMQ74988.1 hypothetical protein ACCUM_2096 [Candidatus Accumulibacter phosphatis]
MRALLSIAVLMSTAMPVFARADLPEPSSITLLGIGALGLLVALRKRK